MSVADRLRVEAEQALASLQESHSTVETKLAQALRGQQEKERELESLRAEHRNVCRKLTDLAGQQQQERAELCALRDAHWGKEITDCGQQTERQDSEQGEGMKKAMEEKLKEAETKANKCNKENGANQEVEPPAVDHYPDMVNESDNTQLTGKGVAEGYLRCLAAEEEKKKERQRDPRKIVMLSERSW